MAAKLEEDQIKEKEILEALTAAKQALKEA